MANMEYLNHLFQQNNWLRYASQEQYHKIISAINDKKHFDFNQLVAMIYIVSDKDYSAIYNQLLDCIQYIERK